MELNTYQRKAYAFAVYPDQGHNLIYPVLGLNGEAGEVAEKLKKLIRDGDYLPGVSDAAVVTDTFVDQLIKELGDVLWYVAATCTELGVTMNEVAAINLSKLGFRAKQGTLHGSGDDR